MKSRILSSLFALLVCLAPTAETHGFWLDSGFLDPFRPDLYVESTTVLKFDTTMAVLVQVRNGGVTDAASFEVFIETPNGTTNYGVWNLAAGESKGVWIAFARERWRTPPTFSIHVDYQNDVVESNENNNTKTIWL